MDDSDRVLDSYPFELSGGMNQRVGICTAMIMHPNLLLADEPTSALDVTVQKQVVEELLLMRKEYNTAMILVTHNIGVVRMMADRILVLQNGQVRDYGETESCSGSSERSIYKETDEFCASSEAGQRIRRSNGMADIILKADHLKKVFISGKKSMTAVDDVSFELEQGECLGIVGESGSGKSTIAKMLTHLEAGHGWDRFFLKERTSPMSEARL